MDRENLSEIGGREGTIKIVLYEKMFSKYMKYDHRACKSDAPPVASSIFSQTSLYPCPADTCQAVWIKRPYSPRFSPMLYLLHAMPLATSLHFLSFKNYFIILCVWISCLPICLCTTRFQCLQRLETSDGPFRPGVIDDCETLVDAW